MIKPNTVDEYFAQLDSRSNEALSKLRGIIKSVVPDAQESISYGMPCFKQNGILVFYASFKNHYSLFPTGSGIKKFQDQLQEFKTSKGTIQFNFNEPLPEDLIINIVKFRVEENLKKILAKKKS